MPPPVFTRSLPGGKIELVVEHDDVVEPDLVEMRGLGDRAAGLVHEGAGQQQQRALAAERALGRHALKAAAPRRKAVAPGNRVDRHEADIVPVARVAGARIAEPDEEQHGVEATARSRARSPATSCRRLRREQRPPRERQRQRPEQRPAHRQRRRQEPRSQRRQRLRRQRRLRRRP